MAITSTRTHLPQSVDSDRIAAWLIERVGIEPDAAREFLDLLDGEDRDAILNMLEFDRRGVQMAAFVHRWRRSHFRQLSKTLACQLEQFETSQSYGMPLRATQFERPPGQQLPKVYRVSDSVPSPAE